MEKTRLDQLSTSVKKTFDPDFVFLIYPEKIQHFPARQWSIRDYQKMLSDKLGPDYELFSWEEKLVAFSKKELFIVLPLFKKITAFKEALQSDA